jgi:hypothetical protein
MSTILRVLACLLLTGGFAAPAGAAGLPTASAMPHHQPALPRWQQQAEITADDGAAGDHLGGPVALSGSTALVGAWDKNHSRGAAYIFVQHGSRWTQQAKLTAADGATGDHFGTAVALSGDTALVGAPGKSGCSGAVYVFVQHGGRWSQQARLVARDLAMRDWFGRSVALSGNTALVGAWYKASGIGAAYIFVRVGSHWTEQARLTAHDGVPGDYFGTSVAVSGAIALVGAGFKNSDMGAAYIFVRRGVRWTERARLSAADGSVGDIFGTAVALSGTTALVGAGFAHGSTGAAYVFVREGDRWLQQARLLADDATAKDWFGRTVALNGDTALVGAWYKNGQRGAAYVFVRHGGCWTEQAQLRAGNGVRGDCFGGSVALRKNLALVGAGFKNNAAGTVYIFSLAS